MSGPEFAVGGRTRRTKGEPMLLAVVAEPRGVRTLVHLPKDQPAQLEAMKTILGGFLECVTLIPNEPQLLMWCNDDGHALDLPPNPFASLIAVAYTPIVLGNILLTGGADANGDITTLDQKWIHTLI